MNTTTMEVQVRQGVRFHDGTPLTVDDVVFSIHRAGSETSDLRGGLKNIVAVEAIDRQTVRIVTSKPGESVWYLLSFVSIMSRAWAEDNGVTVPENRLEGETSYATRHANGTGPFMLEAFEPGGQTVLVRNPNWWGLKDYPHNIDRIEHSVIAEPEARLAALMSGEIDFLFDPPLAGLQQIKDAEGLKITQAAGLRTIWLGMGQGRAELRSSNVNGRNPFNDERVRRAMYHAIDSEAIRDNVMLGYSKPAGMLVPPGIEGYEPELDQRLPYDAETAKALLLEAGYPDGFSVTLDCPNNRLINDEAICEAVAAQLKAVGIERDRQRAAL